MYMVVYIYYFQSRAFPRETFLRLQQYTQPGTRDVFQVGKIKRAPIIHCVEKFLGLGALGGIQPATAYDVSVLPKFYSKHRVNLTPW